MVLMLQFMEKAAGGGASCPVCSLLKAVSKFKWDIVDNENVYISKTLLVGHKIHVKKEKVRSLFQLLNIIVVFNAYSLNVILFSLDQNSNVNIWMLLDV